MSDSDGDGTGAAPCQGFVWISGLPYEQFQIIIEKHCNFSLRSALARLLRKLRSRDRQKVSDSDRVDSGASLYQGLVWISGLPNELFDVLVGKYRNFSALGLFARLLRKL